jgi:effector-binding domain-containing protein
MKKLLSVLTSVFLAGCSVFGLRTAEEPNYQVLNDFGDIQIRHYPAMVVAQTEVTADYKNSSSQGFQRLAGYIFGNNKKQQKIAMTAPVIQEQEAETMAMTAPVIQQKSGTVWLMAFVLPAEYSVSTAPVPLDSAVIIKEIPGKKIAVIRYSGSLSEQGIEEKSEHLKNWLSQQGYQAISEPRSAAYDPPWTLPFLRRNEIHIDIEG